MASVDIMLVDVLRDLDGQLEKSVASELCVPSQVKYDLLKGLLKRLFEVTVKASEKRIGPLSELAVDSLDSETIWEQVQTRNRPLLRYFRNSLNKLDEGLQSLPSEENDESEEELESMEDGEDDYEDSDAAESDVVSDTEDEEGELIDEGVAEGRHHRRGLDPEEEVDYLETFMEEVEDMENKYVDKLMRREAQDGHRGYTEDEEEDEEMDFEIAEQGLYDDADSEDDEAAGARYQDFFGKSKPKMKIVKKDLSDTRTRFTDAMSENDDDGNDSELDGAFDEDGKMGSASDEAHDSTDEENLTTFQKQQRKLRREMAEIEKDLVAQKSWELRGEVKATDRPENSLLEVYVDVEKASKPAPIVTQEYTNTLEEMIIRRIMEQSFDDVVPKLAPVEKPVGDLPEVSQEKSKEGLAEVRISKK